MLPNEFKQHVILEDKHWWFTARRKVILSILQRLSSQEYRHLVEMGCGTGGNLIVLGLYYQHIIGVDISPLALEHARPRVNGSIIHGDFSQVLQGHWHELDIILLADVIEHVEDDHAFLHKIIDSIQSNALLLVTTPAHPSLWSLHNVALGHKRRYTMETFQQLLKQNIVFVICHGTLLVNTFSLAKKGGT